MKAESRTKRHDEILDAAIEVLRERGYRDASMLQVARRASASKETLYAWYGDKRGLFEAVIRRNAQAVQAVLAGHLQDDAPIERVLIEFGRALLQMLLGDSAVAINRAAISEAMSDPQLAQTLADTGRDATLPAFVTFIGLQREQGVLNLENPSEAAADYLGLLLGDSQVRRLLGLVAAPGTSQSEARAARAAKNFMRLHGVKTSSQTSS